MGVWTREQSLREIYLRAFEIAITQGGAFNTMSSFARLGTVAGAADGTVSQRFLKDECGMKGVVISDMYTDMTGAQDVSSYFELAYGIYHRGVDLPDGTDQEWQFEPYRPDGEGKGDYATMAWAMRDAAKRICYMTLNSNAMNGVSRSTRTIRVTPWWQSTLQTVNLTLGCLLGVTLVWIVVYQVLEGRKDKKAALEEKA